MTEELLDAVSEITENGHPIYGNCQLVIGDGTMKIEFRHGRAKVPRSLAGLVARNPHITVYGTSQSALPRIEADEGIPLEGVGFAPDPEVPEGETEAVKLAKEYLASEPEVHTSDGEDRCLARKGDGTQCANKAHDGSACGLQAHRDQLAVA